jgi:hypothetical protein
MTSTEQVQGLTWWTQGTTFSTDMRILDIGAYDAILGVNWLKQFGKMTVDWEAKYLSFNYKGKEVTVQDILSKQTHTVSELSAEQFQKWWNGNKVWALAIVNSVPLQFDSVTSIVSQDVQTILSEFSNVFSETKILPPQHALDHAISLVDTASPVNSRPYRYSPLQKDEIE